jgi:hypothetical protein
MHRFIQQLRLVSIKISLALHLSSMQLGTVFILVRYHSEQFTLLQPAIYRLSTYRVNEHIKSAPGDDECTKGEGHISCEATSSTAIRGTDDMQQHAHDEGQPAQRKYHCHCHDYAKCHGRISER